MSVPATSRQIGPVSPSLLSRLACPLRIAFEQASTGGTSAASAEAVLGNVAHRAIELTLGGDELRDAWVQACKEEKAHFGSDPDDLPSARRTFLRLKVQVPRLVALLNGTREIQRFTEEWLETTDGDLGGQPDLVVIQDDHTAIVIDYKTGLVTDEEGVKSTYVRQLLFYGALVNERLDSLPTLLALLSLREGVVQVDPSREQMAEVAAEARSWLHEFNTRVPGAQPANASEQNCRWCPHAAKCEAFLQEIEPDWTGSVGQAVRGRVEAEPEYASTGVTSLQVMVDDGPLAGSKALLTGIPSDLVSDVDVGSQVSILDLRTRCEEPLVLTWTNKANSLARVAIR